MRVVFAGTPRFAAEALQALLAARVDIAAVLCQPDRPAGRGQKRLAGPVKAIAEAHGLPLLQPLSLREAEVQHTLARLDAQVWVVAAYGLILPPAVLALPTYGCLNIHASLLPRWRGAAPIQRALLAGDRETGVAIMQMEAGLDTGPILREGRVQIAADDCAGSLQDRLSALGARLIVESLQDLRADLAGAQPQSSIGVLYAAKISKDEARLDWTLPAIQLERAVRAFDPAPGARFVHEGVAIRVGRADLPTVRDRETAIPGTVLAHDDGILVQTGSGAIRLQELQRPGGRMLPASIFLQGCPLPVGARLD